jgi:hypothetical protein
MDAVSIFISHGWYFQYIKSPRFDLIFVKFQNVSYPPLINNPYDGLDPSYYNPTQFFQRLSSSNVPVRGKSKGRGRGRGRGRGSKSIMESFLERPEKEVKKRKRAYVHICIKIKIEFWFWLNHPIFFNANCLWFYRSPKPRGKKNESEAVAVAVEAEQNDEIEILDQPGTSLNYQNDNILIEQNTNEQNNADVGDGEASKASSKDESPDKSFYDHTIAFLDETETNNDLLDVWFKAKFFFSKISMHII